MCVCVCVRERERERERESRCVRHACENTHTRHACVRHTHFNEKREQLYDKRDLHISSEKKDLQKGPTYKQII